MRELRDERDIADRGGVFIELLTEVLVEDDDDDNEDEELVGGTRGRWMVIGFEVISIGLSMKFKKTNSSVSLYENHPEGLIKGRKG